MKRPRGCIEIGSDNVFADIGLPDADECLAKARLAMVISDLIQERHLTQVQAARLLKTTQPRISDLLAGRLSGLGIPRLLRFLLAMDQDIEIIVRPRSPARSAAIVTVVSGR